MRKAQSGLGYRILLHFYPRDYRRERGQEMVGTFLDSGRTRPSPREALNLFVHGMRTRLGRPASWAVVVGAFVTSILCGLFVAAGATRLAWETAYPLPGDDHAAAVIESALPNLGLGRGLRRDKQVFVQLDADEDEPHEFGSLHAKMTGEVTSDRMALAEATRDRLVARGWEVSGPHLLDRGGSYGHYASLQASRGADLLEIKMVIGVGTNGTNLIVSLSPATPRAVHAAGWGAGLLGALLGWMVFGWASRRMAVRLWAQAFARFFWLMAIAVLSLPIAWGVLGNAPWHVETMPLRWRPLWEWLGYPAGWLPLRLGFAFALLALVFACSPTRARATKGIQRAPWVN